MKNRYYFTFGTDTRFPYKENQIVEIVAETNSDARKFFQAVHPNREGSDYLNFAFDYTESEFKEICSRYQFECAERIIPVTENNTNTYDYDTEGKTLIVHTYKEGKLMDSLIYDRVLKTVKKAPDLTLYKDKIRVVDMLFNDINNDISFGYEIWSDDAYRLMYPDLDSLSEDAWINFYTLITKDNEVKGIFFKDENDSSEAFEYQMNDNEREMFTNFMNDYCKQETDKTIKECFDEMDELNSYDEDIDLT